MSEEIYEVEKIVSIRKESKKFKESYIMVQIKWKDYSHSQNTWEPVTHLNNKRAKEMLLEFKDDNIENSVIVDLVDEAIDFLSVRSSKRKQNSQRKQSKREDKKAESLKAGSSKKRRHFIKEEDSSQQSLTPSVNPNIADKKQKTVRSDNSPLKKQPLDKSSNESQPAQRFLNLSVSNNSLDSDSKFKNLRSISNESSGSKNYESPDVIEKMYGELTYNEDTKEFFINVIYLKSDDRLVDQIKVLPIEEAFNEEVNKELIFKIVLEKLIASEKKFEQHSKDTISRLLLSLKLDAGRHGS